MLLALSCLAGMGGLRLLAVCFVPLLGAAVFEFICSEENTWEKIKNNQYLYASFGASLFAGIGYIINVKVLSKIYSFANWGDVRFTGLNFEQLGNIIKDMLQMMGYRGDRRVISSEGIVNLLILLSCIVLIYMYGALICRYKGLEREERILVLYSGLSLAATIVVGVFTNQNWTARYLSLPMINFVVIWAIYIRLFKIKSIKNQMACVCLAITLFFSGTIEYRSWATDNKNAYREKVIEYLQSEGYTFGFADWDSADVLTELTNNDLHMCKVTNWKEFSIWYWLMEKKFLDYAQNKKVFILIENSKLNFSGDIGYLNGEWELSDLYYLEDGDKVYDDGIYSIYSYDNINMLENIVQKKF